MTDEIGFTAPANVPGQAESREYKPLFEEWLNALGVDEDATEPGAELRARFRDEFRVLYAELLSERVPVLDERGAPVLNAAGRPKTKLARDWRKAAYEAWSSLPASLREPKTLTEFADRIGLSSPSTIRHWRRKDPDIESRFKERLTARLLEYAPDVMLSLIAAASIPDNRGHGDRKLFLEITGMYRGRSTTAEITNEVSSADGGSVETRIEIVYSDPE